MGLLKHFVLPAFGLVHLASLAACKDLATFGKMIGCDNDKTSAATPLQNHMLGIVRGFNLAMLTLCGVGIFGGKAVTSSDTRQAIAVAEFALFSVVTIDAYQQKLNYYVPGVQALLALGGTIVSFMEPGIFTKDHKVKK